jgi:hypothetical protein
VGPPPGASQNAWVYICPQTTKSMHQLIGMQLSLGVLQKDTIAMLSQGIVFNNSSLFVVFLS